MICRAWRLAFPLVVTLALLASCSSTKDPQYRPASSVPQPSAATADACVAPEGVGLQDQDRSDHQVPWKRNGAAKVVITFEIRNLTPDWVAEMQKGVAAWNRSPCLDTKLVQTCQPNTNCVTVSVAPESTVGADGNFRAVESGGFTVGGPYRLFQLTYRRCEDKCRYSRNGTCYRACTPEDRTCAYE